MKRKNENTLSEQYGVMNEGIDMNMEYGYWILNIKLHWTQDFYLVFFYVGGYSTDTWCSIWNHHTHILPADETLSIANF